MEQMCQRPATGVTHACALARIFALQPIMTSPKQQGILLTARKSSCYCPKGQLIGPERVGFN